MRIDLPNETWKDIEGYEGRYQVSDRGRVYDVLKDRFCVGYNGKGVISAHLDGKHLSVARLVALHFIFPRTGALVFHLDRDYTNNRVDNLRWGKSPNAANPKKKKADDAPKKRGRKAAPSRPVLQYDEFWNLTATHESVLDAARSLEIRDTAIQTVHKRLLRAIENATYCYKSYWQYQED